MMIKYSIYSQCGCGVVELGDTDAGDGVIDEYVDAVYGLREVDR
jgi:hypothetical protein